MNPPDSRSEHAYPAALRSEAEIHARIEVLTIAAREASAALQDGDEDQRDDLASIFAEQGALGYVCERKFLNIDEVCTELRGIPGQIIDIQNKLTKEKDRLGKLQKPGYKGLTPFDVGERDRLYQQWHTFVARQRVLSWLIYEDKNSEVIPSELQFQIIDITPRIQTVTDNNDQKNHTIPFFDVTVQQVEGDSAVTKLHVYRFNSEVFRVDYPGDFGEFTPEDLPQYVQNSHFRDIKPGSSIVVQTPLYHDLKLEGQEFADHHYTEGQIWTMYMLQGGQPFTPEDYRNASQAIVDIENVRIIKSTR